ncbi:MAG: SDR family oxidoreductase [Archangiaceae bacterium]|nr:SDR family oxidoreductase [Archangiaceae bacterium]
MSPLSGRVYVVTGSTQGLGEACAVKLASLGAAGVVVTGRSDERGLKVVSALEKAGTAAVFVRAALENIDQVRAIVPACEKRFGRLDGLVNAAGLSTRGSLENTSVEVYDHLFAVNVRAPFFLMQDGVKLMKKGGRGGSIASISSQSAHGGQPFLTAYSTTKGALNTLTRNAANSVRRDRIRVNAINLGWAHTPGEEAVQKSDGSPADWLAKAEARQPFGRLVQPRDVASLVAYLMGDESEMMTGALIDLDQNVAGTYE